MKKNRDTVTAANRAVTSSGRHTPVRAPCPPPLPREWPRSSLVRGTPASSESHDGGLARVPDGAGVTYLDSDGPAPAVLEPKRTR
jgi:hypothetical protein